MRTLRLGIFTCIVLAGTFRSTIRAEEIRWRTDYQAALKEAREKKRPLITDVYTQSCFWCTRLDQTTFRDPQIVKILNEQFVPLKIDAVQQGWIADALGVQRYPTLVFATPDSTILTIREGFLDVGQLQDRLTKSLEESKALKTSATTKRAEK